MLLPDLRQPRVDQPESPVWGLRTKFNYKAQGQIQKFKDGEKTTFQLGGEFENNKAGTKSNQPNQEVSDIKKKNGNSFDQVEDKANDVNNWIGPNPETPS